MAEYKDPVGGTPSTIGTQIRTDHYNKKALVEAKRTQFFTQLADVTAMPKHSGKKMKRYHYMPLLDDRNVNDQGIDASGATIANGNLYGSSKDIGNITGKLPLLTENGGMVNRVGFKRLEIEGTIEKFGLYSDYTQESMDFDTDEELEMHITREMVVGASELSEDMLQVDLLTKAGTVRYGGVATATTEITGEGSDISLITYEDLMRLDIDLDNNRTPKHTKIITGTRMTDTKTVPAARYLYIGTELQPMVEKMTDHFGNQAFISVEKYAAGTTTAMGEIGAVGRFRIIVNPEMQFWAGAGATETVANAGYRATGGKYDVYPMLVVGDESFSTIGFQTDGKSVKFSIKHSKPGSPESYANDRFGEKGFMSIKWYYGMIVLRPERIAVCKTVAEL